MNLLEVNDIEGLFCDGFVVDEEGFLIFASFWGRDTGMQEFLGRMSLPIASGGIHSVRFKNFAQCLRLGNPDRLDKLSGRMPKRNIFGDMAQLHIFDRLVREPDYSGCQAYRLVQDGIPEQVVQEQAWQLFKSVCHLPMLEKWKHELLTTLKREQWFVFYQGFNLGAISLKLPETELNQTVSQMICNGLLTV